MTLQDVKKLELDKLVNELERKSKSKYDSFGFAPYIKLDPKLQLKILKNDIVVIRPEKAAFAPSNRENHFVLVLLMNLSEKIKILQREKTFANGKIKSFDEENSLNVEYNKTTNTLLSYIDSHIIEVLLKEPDLLLDENFLQEFFNGLCMINNLVTRLKFKADSRLKEYLLFPEEIYSDNEIKLIDATKKRCHLVLNKVDSNLIPKDFLNDELINYMLTYSNTDSIEVFSLAGLKLWSKLYYKYPYCEKTQDMVLSHCAQHRFLFNSLGDDQRHTKRVERISNIIEGLLKILVNCKLVRTDQLPLDDGIMRNLYDHFEDSCILEADEQNLYAEYATLIFKVTDDKTLFEKIGYYFKNFYQRTQAQSQGFELTKKSVWYLINPKIYDKKTNTTVKSVSDILKRANEHDFICDPYLLNRLIEHDLPISTGQIEMLLISNKWSLVSTIQQNTEKCGKSDTNCHKNVFADKILIDYVLNDDNRAGNGHKICMEHLVRIKNNKIQNRLKQSPLTVLYPHFGLVIRYLFSLGLGRDADTFKTYYNLLKKSDLINLDVVDIEHNSLFCFLKISKVMKLVNYISPWSLQIFTSFETHEDTIDKIELFMQVYREVIVKFDYNSTMLNQHLSIFFNNFLCKKISSFYKNKEDIKSSTNKQLTKEIEKIFLEYAKIGGKPSIMTICEMKPEPDPDTQIKIDEPENEQDTNNVQKWKILDTEIWDENKVKAEKAMLDIFKHRRFVVIGELLKKKGFRILVIIFFILFILISFIIFHSTF